ncbi:hypothetical protein CDL12_03538 [Handroanthus impetiginosus]|uniref:Late embryogenesis abundant protein LEA-2 subgroup domain-containing protein n=1 Tax=Handroanthus impetiginosus TaxID=429701 RepID=A0A2G9I1W6_9LAMI|nr:hypothetical protein CDL12_03538 [Handroanthus impetiginosus]
MAHYRMDSEEEALFRSYPYALYFVQSPSTISHATSNTHVVQSPNFLHSSSRGSNNSFLQETKKKYTSRDHDHVLEDGEKCGVLINMKKGVDCEEDEDEEEEEYYGYGEKNGGWIKYLSFSYSNSGWWVLLQLSWRFMLSLIVALIVFYVAAKPPPPTISLKVARIRQFRLGEGVDASGVTTKLLSCNSSMDLIIDNNSKLFGLHIHPPTTQLFFGHLPLAMSQTQGGELYAGSHDLIMLKLSIGTRNKPIYGAGRNMQDLLESREGLPLVIRVSLRSSFHVIWGLFKPKFHHQAQCLVVLTDKYDKKHRTQVYKSTCTINN